MGIFCIFIKNSLLCVWECSDIGIKPQQSGSEYFVLCVCVTSESGYLWGWIVCRCGFETAFCLSTHSEGPFYDKGYAEDSSLGIWRCQAWSWLPAFVAVAIWQA